MIINKQQKGKNKQNGLALLVLVVVIFLAASSYYFSSISMVEIKVDKIEKTQAVLKRAKQALLDYVLVKWQLAGEAGKIGRLPCPDYRSNGVDGEQDISCGTAYANGIGYFPWRTLGIDTTKDSSGSCLLYAVSPAYKTTPVAALNPDSYGQFRIVDQAGAVLQGATPEDRPVAVIIAPGPALHGLPTGQDRENNPPAVCGSYYSDDLSDLLEEYLDDDDTTDNADIDTGINNVIENFVTAYVGSDADDRDHPLNDRLITISHSEVWGVVEDTIESAAFNGRMRNLTEAIAVCFAAYGLNTAKKNLPMPAPLNINGGEYRRNIDYQDSGVFTTAFAGRLPYKVSSANTVLANLNLPNIFDNAFCDVLNLPSTGGNDDINFSDDAGADNGVYFDLWQNWKDHFFYVVSEQFKPDGAADNCGGGDCVVYNGASYAALIFFSGLKLDLPAPAQSRYSPPFEVDEKSDISNYLEEGREGVFPDNNGNGVYPGITAGSNDIVFCIAADMSVVAC